MSVFGAAAMAAGVPGLHGVMVNGVVQPGFAYLVFDDVSQPYMALKDFTALGFAITVPAVWRDGLEVVPLDGQAGLATKIDAQQLMLSLEVDPRWYEGTRTTLNAMSSAKPLPALPGALLNYSLQLARVGDTPVATGSTQSLSLFGPAGLLQLSTAVNSVGAPAPGSAGLSPRHFSRLGTTFFHDNEEQRTTLSVGDGVLPIGVGVPVVRYGGITWQSNFGLDPNFSTLETPAIFDAARLPSTLEFFLNDRRVGSPLAVPAGPFEISGLPTVDGAGQVKVLIRDALNNERTVTVPYLHTARLYRQGLHSFSYTAGMLRPDLDRYDSPFLASAHRWGLTRWLTLDAGGSFSADSNSLGAGATFPLQDNVVGDARVAMSKSPAGAGQQWGTSAQWLVSVASIGASMSHSSATFRLLGDSVSALARPRDDLRLFASRALGHDLGSVSASFGRLSTWGDGTRAISSLSWVRSFRDFSLSVSAVRSSDTASLQLGLSIPLSHQGFFSSSLQKRDATTTWRSDYASAPLTGNGLAVRAGMTAANTPGADDVSSAMGALDARTDIGEHGVQVDSRARSTSWRVRTAGSLGVLAGHAFWGPPIGNGFALVSTGDAPSIPVYRWNLPVAVSDARGLALVTSLSPYRNNLLAIRPDEVPLAYRVTDHEVTAVPRGRGGVFVAFAMRRERPALLTLHVPGGQPVPIGASVLILDTGETAPVGQRGEVYLQHVPEHAELEIRFKNKRCRITPSRPATTDPQPRLGPFICAWGLVP
ncbi:fimbria/pilus outer membrane usher protein [Limnohabitans sp. Jir72]|uniref:fimbria/pilus outer membrane usher protein n=1 Tax=Limnohabitans sp. Jir72 TaxID=1977909 RepID=UPI001304C6AD|nr:fimbria/pilus outer membrane usher protein [Limnohabitans sp. Jir72]